MQLLTNRYKILAFLFLFILFNPYVGFAKKIIYIPIDNRPVCLKYPVNAINAYGYNIITPPETMLSSREKGGDPEKLWDWLLKNSKDADSIVIASDSLIYGGLVQSRTHFLAQETILARINKLKDLKKISPKLKVYCFSSLLRTPRQSFGNVEPPYYEQYGSWFFRLGELQDKTEIYGYDYLDATEIKNLTELIPQEYYKDWFDRREKNLSAHFALAELARNKFFHYYAVGKDDHAPLSQTHMEARKLKEYTSDISSARFHIIPGIDQVGILLLVRAINEDTWTTPYIHTVYAEGTGPLTVPLYSDETIGESVQVQIMAAGAYTTSEPEKADLVLVLNTPVGGINKEAINPENQPFSSPENRRLISKIIEFSKEHPVALADVAYANGSDNGFMHELYKQNSIYALTSYAGWNTADNSIGFALTFGLLAKKQKPVDHMKILQTRLIDDWYYQANVRQNITREFKTEGYNIYYLDKQQDMATKILLKDLNEFNKKYGNFIKSDFSADFPWNRLFEIDVEVKIPRKQK